MHANFHVDRMDIREQIVSSSILASTAASCNEHLARSRAQAGSWAVTKNNGIFSHVYPFDRRENWHACTCHIEFSETFQSARKGGMKVVQNRLRHAR